MPVEESGTLVATVSSNAITSAGAVPTADTDTRAVSIERSQSERVQILTEVTAAAGARSVRVLLWGYTSGADADWYFLEDLGVQAHPQGTAANFATSVQVRVGGAFSKLLTQCVDVVGTTPVMTTRIGVS